jgi:hypothetical protein
MTDKDLSDFIEHGESGFQEFAIAFGYAWASMAIQIAKELRTRQRESRIDKMINQQKKEWVGLTAEEKRSIFDSCERDDRGYVAAMVEEKLKQKNT